MILSVRLRGRYEIHVIRWPLGSLETDVIVLDGYRPDKFIRIKDYDSNERSGWKFQSQQSFQQILSSRLLHHIIE